MNDRRRAMLSTTLAVASAVVIAAATMAMGLDRPFGMIASACIGGAFLCGMLLRSALREMRSPAPRANVTRIYMETASMLIPTVPLTSFLFVRMMT